VEINQKTLML